MVGEVVEVCCCSNGDGVVTLRLPMGPVTDDEVDVPDDEMVETEHTDADADDDGGCPIGVMDRPLPGAASGFAVFGTVIGGNGGTVEASTIVGPGPLVAMGGINDEIF